MIPLAKTGGLGDVCGSLPVALERCGCRCSAFLPAYRSVMRSGLRIEPTPHTFTIPIGGRHVACRILRTQLPNSSVDVYLIDQPQYYDRDGLYHDRHGEYRDNCERFSFFCRAVIQAIEQLNLDIDIIHCHDWQAGLVPAYVETKLGGFRWMDRVRSVMTIHNLAYQGRFWHVDMPLTGLGWEYFNHHQMEFHGELNLMKTGIAFANTVTTVSPTHAREIQTEEYGKGLDTLLRQRRHRLAGILNGVDYAHWDPASDPLLPAHYSATALAGKDRCRAALAAELGLQAGQGVPIVGMVSRLAQQKGIDILIHALPALLAERRFCCAILGSGEPGYVTALRELAARYPGRVAFVEAQDEGLAHRVYAGSDLFLVPSLYEPCGLTQMYAMRYGAVPVVRRTGGLADTVSHFDPATGQGTGSVFLDADVGGLGWGLRAALDWHAVPAHWARVVANGMAGDWSWEHQGPHYEALFTRLVNGGATAPRS